MFQTLLYVAAIFGVIAFFVLIALSGFILNRIRMMRSEIDHKVDVDMMLEDPYPPALHLWSEHDFELQEANLIADFKALEKAGFVELARYTILELPLSLCAMRHPDNYVAILYRHERGFGWTEIRTHFQNGDFQLVSNCPFGQELLMPEFASRLYDENLDGHALFEKAKDMRDRDDVENIDEDHFVSLFQSCYRREYNWRTENQIGALEVAKLAGEEGDPAETAEYVNTLKEQHAERNKAVERDILHGFLKQTQMTALQWEERRDRIRVVHNYLGLDELCACFNLLPLFDAKARENIQIRLEAGEEPVDIFASINAAKSAERRFDDLYRTVEPHRATIYLQPASETD